MRAINRNKIIAVMSAIVVFMVSMCTYSAEANATNTSRTYKVYNAQTGAYLQQRDYTLLAFDTYPNINNTRSIIGDDTRQPDTSNIGVVCIETDSGFGTGFIIGDHEIATAAHCVSNRDYKNNKFVSSKITDITLIYNNEMITFTPVEYHIPVSYTNLSINSDGYDYALITVENDLSEYTQFELGAPTDTIVYSDLDVKISGFPGKVRDQTANIINNRPVLYTGTGDVYDINDTQVLVTTYASSGNSGGPIYIEETRGNYTYLTAIAVYFAGSGYADGSEGPNVGLRFTTDQLHFYRNNPYINYE